MFNAHLHIHTEYSALDGLCKIEELILKAKELGQSAIAITDHGSSSGLYEAYNLGIKHNFNVLLGEEFYFQNADNKNGHIIIIAKNEEGLKNIYKMQALANNNFYYKPRITMDILKDHSEGLICTTACIANQVGQYILAGANEQAFNHAMKLKEIFGDDFYIELQSSTVDEVVKVNKVLLEWVKTYNFKYIITNDVHYVNKEDYNIHEVMLCIQQKSKMNSPKRWKFEKNDYWLKSQEELEYYMPYMERQQFDKAYSYIDEIVNKCKDVEIKKGNHLPKWVDENGLSEEDALDKLTFDSYFTKQKERGETNAEYLKDLVKELDVIKSTGYAGYFMIVQEYVNWAKNNGVLVGDGRGSGAGCKVAYTIGITDVNPQKYDLLFERFLTKGRVPDIDCDFADIDAVFRHLQNRYGKNNVARVGAFNRFTCKSALRKVMGVYSFPQSVISQIVSYLPNRPLFTYEEAVNESVELKNWLEEHDHINRCVKKLEGKMSHLSTHAGGVIICNDLTSMLPVFTDSEDREKLIIAYDHNILEKLGHYKFDVLGLKSLILLHDALNNINDKIDWHKVDFEDEKVYNMLCSGDVLGVFQLSEQKDKVMEQAPRCFSDLIAINAIVRPGVCDWNEYIESRRNGIHSDLKFLDETHGLIVYQEQYLLLAQHYAGWDLAFADNNIRKNKKILEDTELRQKFINDGIGNGYEEAELNKIWESILEVVGGGYSFNKSHATSYAKIAYQTAWLKCYYPKEFYAAYLTQNFDDFIEISKVSARLKELNIKLLCPDINESSDKFKVTDEGIMYPITSIKGVGGSVLYEINRLRPIKSYSDFMERRVPKFVKKTALYALIKSGAFDNFGKSRREMLEDCCYPDHITDNPKMEKETLGVYISENPLEKYRGERKISDYKNGEFITCALQLTSLSIVHDKKGNEMAFAVGISADETVKLVIFSSSWSKYKNIAKDDAICLIKAKKDGQSLLVNVIENLE